MICYKDKSFCTSSHICGNVSCSRNFNDEEKEGALVWWGNVDAPIAYADFNKDGCGFTEVKNVS